MIPKFKWQRSGAVLLRVFLAAWTLLCGSIPSQAAGPLKKKQAKAPVQASPVQGVQPAETVEEENGDGDPKDVRLTFFNAPWTKVLAKLAEQSHSTLIMHAVPSGRYTKNDLHKYTRKEAVRILNNELEPEGYRILEKDTFLVVVQIKVLNTRYTRPKVSASSKPAPAATAAKGEAQTAEAPAKREHMQSATVRGKSAKKKPVRSEIIQAAAEEEDDALSQVQTADQAATNENAFESEEPAAPAQEETKAAEPSVKIVKAKHKTARELAQSVYRAFKPRTELVDKGTHGMPAFRAFRVAKTNADEAGLANGDEIVKAKGELLFTIEIDGDGNQLLIEAAPKVAEDVAGLLRAMDRPVDENGKTVQIMPAPERTQQIAKNLRPNVAELIAQRKQEEGGDAEDLPGEPAKPKAGAPAGKDVQELLGGIKGDLRFESMDDLGVIIFEGNEQDVQRMMQVIKEIERLSLAAVPSIELKLLKNVNSESLAPLLTSVYEAMSTQSSQGATTKKLVSVFAVVKPNAILIVAPTDDVDEVSGLIDKLDQPVDPQNEFQIFPLKNAVSTQIQQTIEQFYAERTGLGTKVKVVADVRSNSVIVQARPSDMHEVEALVQKLDRDESGAVSRMQIFPIRHASAEDLANIINRAILSVLNPAAATGTSGIPTTGFGGQGQGGGQQGGGGAGAGRTGGGAGANNQDLQQTKSVVLEFLAIDGEAKKLVRSGVLADIRVTADARVNSLVVTAPEQSMQLMAALIAQLDQPSATVSDIKIFSLINSDAEAMVTLLQSVFGVRSQQQQNAGGGGVDGAAPAFDDADTSVLPLRFSVDSRTNSIVAVGSGGALRVVEAILLRLDEGEVRGRKNTVIRLKNSPSEQVAEAVNNFLTSQRELAQIDPNLVSSTELLEREIIAVPEPVSNSLLISATPRYYEEILKMVAKLDEAPAQVIIQALLVEVDLQNTDEFGIELGLQDSILFDRSLTNPDNLQFINETIFDPVTGFASQQQSIISQEGVPGYLFNNTGPLGNNFSTATPSRVGGQGLSNFGLGRLNGDLGFGGLVLSASSESVSALLRALSAKRQIHVLSRPQIRTLDNQEATIHVGQQVPVVDRVDATQAFVTPTVRQQPVGITLTVVPRISPDETIVMRVEAVKSALSAQGVPIFFDTVGNRTIDSPIIDITEALATVSVSSGQTIVLGGMITKSDNTLERKVPWLGDIPIIGRAFRYDGTTTRRTELLMFLTPRVIKTDADNELIKQVEAERLHFIEEEAEMIHGPLYGIPAADESAAPTPAVIPPTPDDTQSTTTPTPPLPEPEKLPSDAEVPMSVVPRKSDKARVSQAAAVQPSKSSKSARVTTAEAVEETDAGRVDMQKFVDRHHQKTK